jgi:small subunit ribosomal protein S17
MPRRVLQGIVVSAKMNKTVLVRVESRVMHPIYKKYIKRHKKYAAHSEENSFQLGDFVRIVESRPISKTKKWIVESKVSLSGRRTGGDSSVVDDLSRKGGSI